MCEARGHKLRRSPCRGLSNQRLLPHPKGWGSFLLPEGLCFLIDYRIPPPAHSGAPCRLRRRPPAGGSEPGAACSGFTLWGHFHCGNANRGKGALAHRLFPYPAAMPQLLGGCFAAAAEPANRGSSFRFRAPVKGRARRAGVTSVGGWVGSNVPPGRAAKFPQRQPP